MQLRLKECVVLDKVVAIVVQYLACCVAQINGEF